MISIIVILDLLPSSDELSKITIESRARRLSRADRKLRGWL